ncbi:MAG: biotin operon repressor, partial [bacterium]
MTKVLAKDGRLAITEDKVRLLNVLKEHEGEFVSGQDLAEAMGLTRPAVWKDIQYFKELNYKIEARSNVGYRLVSAPDILHPIEFLPYLKTQTFGRNCHYYRVIDSTNKAAKRLIQKGVPDGTAVLAEYQSKGAGRLGRKWFSPFGKNVILSL